MATKKTTKPPAGERTTIAVPGGMAQFYSKAELPPRRAREFDVEYAAMRPVVERAVALGFLEVSADASQEDEKSKPEEDDKEDEKEPPAPLTKDEIRSLFALNELAVWTYLKSWTLDEDLPTSPDTVLDLGPSLYKALTEHAAKIVASLKDVKDRFTVDALPDDEDEDPGELPT